MADGCFGLRCPLCGRPMIRMEPPSRGSLVEEGLREDEPVYYCDRHGVLNKLADLREAIEVLNKKAYGRRSRIKQV